MSNTYSRRKALQLLAGTFAAIELSPFAAKAKTNHSAKNNNAFTYCLNMATIREHKLGFIKELQVASKAGFHSVEIWMDSLQSYLNNNGTLKEAKKYLDDVGLTVENNIGFAEWIVDDETRRKKGLEQMKKEMDMLAQIGCKRTAAPPIGATELLVLDLDIIAERFRAVLELGHQTGVMPQLEMWGFSKNLGRVSEVMYVALESGDPSAKILLDVFHLFKGGTPLNTLSFINPSVVDILHVNDYPANLSASVITDADRVYPGDGVAPLKSILQILGNRQKPLIISTEVFNKKYYAQDALTAAKTALAKMKTVTANI